MPELQLVLEGQMPSGKNRVKEVFIRGKKIRYPDKRFKLWRKDAYQQLRDQRGSWEILRTWARVRVRYWPKDMITRDVSGIMDALCHLLEYCPVCKKKNKECEIPAVQNDGLLIHWSWERMPVDRARPRIEVLVSPTTLP
jgi:hypothetical protein